MQNVADRIQQVLGLSYEFQTSLLLSLFAVILLFIARRAVLTIVNRRTKDVSIRYRWRKTATYVTFLFGVFIVGGIWFRGIQFLSTYLGLLSAGLAIALHTPLVNLAAWVFILWRKPFSVGDRIEIGEVRGDVIDQRIFMFTLMEIGNRVDAEQSTGRVIHIPNGKIFEEPLANYNDGFRFIWNEIPVLVTFESDWEKAKEILLEIAHARGEELSKSAEIEIKKAARKMMIYLSKLTPIVYTSVKDSGVLLTIRYLCDPRRRRGSEQEIWEDILHAFQKCENIDFAYPTERHYLNYLEGKSEARAEIREKK